MHREVYGFPVSLFFKSLPICQGIIRIDDASEETFKGFLKIKVRVKILSSR